ncbi:MAG: NFACT RNA binding domain-containing protein [Rhodothermales bacterium]
MLTNWYTLYHLVAEWRPDMVGARVVDAYSQHRGSLKLVLESSTVRTLSISLQAPHRHLFMYEGSNRARKNVADLFPDALGRHVTDVRLADRDRILYIDLSEGLQFVVVPFGPRANVFLMRSAPGTEPIDTFRGDDTPPDPRPATSPDALFPKPLKKEVQQVLAHEPGLDQEEAAQALHARLLASPEPVVYWDGDWPEVLSVVPLGHLEGALRPEHFANVNAAVRTTARSRMAQARFHARWKPLVQRVEARLGQVSSSLERMLEELDRPSRADTYERNGHLLMASSHAIPAGLDGVELEDIVGGEGVVHIALDPALSAVRNAERYYDKARRTRLARENALERLEDVEAERDRLRVVSDALAAVRTLDELDAVQEAHAGVIDGLQRGGDSSDAVPYRRFALDGGYEVWVGRNARQNDQLTLHDSRKYDLWMHARGVAGSHTVLRVKGRTDRPPRYIIEQAAAIAAYFSKARTSAMAPVMMTERKYVRKPRKAVAGAVVVEREEVVMIEPGLHGKAF